MPPRQPARAATTAKPTSPSSLHEALELAASAATTRAVEGKQLYMHAADMLDKHQLSDEIGALPAHMKRAFKAFSEDISLVAQRHFEAYIRGNPRPATPYTIDPNTPASPPESVPELPARTPTRSRSGSRSTPSLLHSPPTTYAMAAACPPSILKTSSSNTTSARPKPRQPKQAYKPDTRLFVRLPAGHQARLLSSYTILSKLRSSLGENSKFIKEVQITETGFALQPASIGLPPNLDSLFTGITNFFGEGCLVEKANNWLSYRISSVPRNITTLDGLGQLIQDPVSPQLITSALAEATGVAPVAAAQTKTSLDTPHSYSTDWIVRFPENTPRLPYSLNILGVRASARFLPNKVNIIQCGRCFQWHNERRCARPTRCRLCGSTEHTEDKHPNCSPELHPCPPRCLHCHGPHPADSPECLLRPTPNGNKLTKQQIAQIRQTCAKARLVVGSAAGCPKTQPTPSILALNPDQTQGTIPPRPITPPPRTPSEPLTTARRQHFASPPPLQEGEDPFEFTPSINEL